jgi:hypothetical protein
MSESEYLGSEYWDVTDAQVKRMSPKLAFKDL